MIGVGGSHMETAALYKSDHTHNRSECLKFHNAHFALKFSAVRGISFVLV